MDTQDEIALEDHHYFQARLDHLQSRHPAMLLNLLETGTLTNHLRAVAMRAMRIRGRLVIDQKMPDNEADELVMSQMVADPSEPMSLLKDSARREKLRRLLEVYRASIPSLPRTYLSQSETIE